MPLVIKKDQATAEPAAVEIYHPPTGVGRDDNREFRDALIHVIEKTFFAFHRIKGLSFVI